MSDYTPTLEDRDRLSGALTNVLCNASNFPEKVQSRILGQDMGPLNDRTPKRVSGSHLKRCSRRQR